MIGLDDPGVILWLLGGNVSLAVATVRWLATGQRRQGDRLDQIGETLARLDAEMTALRRDVQRLDRAT